MNTSWYSRGVKSKLMRRLGIYAALLMVFYRAVAGLASVPLHVDEFVYIHHSNWLNELGRAGAAVYQVSGDTLRDPPITPLLIGLSLRAGGYTSAPAYAPGDVSSSGEVVGAYLPDAPQLWLIRFPMAALFTLSAALSAGVLLRAAGFGGAFVGLLALAGSAYLLLHARRAMTEAPMLLFLVALIWAAGKGWDALRRAGWKRALLLAAGLGGLAGLGVASKHNAAINLVVLGGWIALARAWSDWQLARAKVAAAILLAGVAILAGLATFVVLTPMLHAAPAERLMMMLAERQHLLARQQAANDRFRLVSVEQRLTVSFQRVLNHYLPANCALNPGQQLFWDSNARAYRASAGGVPSPLVGTPLCASLLGWVTPLAVIHIGLIALGGWRLWRAGSVAPLARALLVFGGVNVAFTMLLIPLDWDRYHLLTVFFGTLLAAVGTAEAACRLVNRVAAPWARKRESVSRV
ncbi:MAG: hypothetical protein KatS3mg052_2783 [Candidatus Roseilinea sp.]|nr:MAG: hypothetical protein KatS3mg052_2783 [Candidatus Roseilinea sp.]